MNILLGLAVVFAIVLAFFDWNWFREPLERHLSQRSGRDVHIGDLHVTLGLHPSVRFRDLHVPNAAWTGNDRPLIKAGEAVFTLSLRTLWDERRVLSVIVLRDAEVNMEWEADGRRNWRLTNPEYRGRGRFKVMRLDAVRSSLRFVNHGVDLDLRTEAKDLPEGADPKYNTRVEYQGRFRGRDFSGGFLTQMPLPMQDSGDVVPLRGNMRWAATSVDVDGRVADFWRPSMIDADVRAKGPSLSQLHPFLNVALPETRPYAFVGRVTQDGTEVTDASLRGKVGSSPLQGNVRYIRSKSRPQLRAALHLGAAKLTDFAVSAEDEAAPGAPLFPPDKFKTDRLRAGDLDLKADAKQLQVAGMVLTDVKLEAALEDGVLQVKPFSFGLAGGRVSATLSAEDGDGALDARAGAEFSGLRLERLPWVAKRARIAGPLKGRIALSGRGRSIAEIMAHASGRADLALEKGSISRLADAQMALDGGRILAAKLGRDRDIAILSANVGLDVKNGLGTVSALAVETEQTRLKGAGSVDLRKETLDLLLTPEPKDPGLLSMRGAFVLQGPIRKPGFKLQRAGTPVAAVEK